MDSLQEAYLLLDAGEMFQHLLPHQKMALIFHSINLYRGLKCTGFQEDDPKLDSTTGIFKLPEGWQSESIEVASFRYEYPHAGVPAQTTSQQQHSQQIEEFYFKFVPVADKFEVNALSSHGENNIYSSEFELIKDLDEDKFTNLDSWVLQQLLPQYEKEILNKLLRNKKEEEKKEDQQKQPPQYDPFPLAGGGRGMPQPQPYRPHIIGDPLYPPVGGDLFIPPSFRPPGTTGPGGSLVGPGSSIFQPQPGSYPDYGIDPATGGGIPFLGGNDPNDLFPSIPGITDPSRGIRPPFPGSGRGGFPNNNPFGGGGGFGGFGGGGFM